MAKQINNNAALQMNKKIETMQNTINELQDDKDVLVDLLRTVKKSIESQSLTFCNKSLVSKFCEFIIIKNRVIIS